MDGPPNTYPPGSNTPRRPLWASLWGRIVRMLRGSTLGKNTIANGIGKLWTAALSLVVVPYYLRFLGQEGYGLIAAIGSLLAFSGLLDLGLGATATKEMAAMPAGDEGRGEARDFIYTLQIIYGAIGLAFATLVVACAAPIATHWLRYEYMSRERVIWTIVVAAAAFAVQWMLVICNAALGGLQRQVEENAILVGVTTVQYVGGVLLLWHARTPVAYFVWQAATTLLRLSLVWWRLWRALALPGHKPTFRLERLRNALPFAGGVTISTLMVFLLTQGDRILLSRFTSLAVLGRYNVAMNISNILSQLSSPVIGAAFPRLVQLAQHDDNVPFDRLYERIAQGLAMVLFPVGATLLACSRPLLENWLRDPSAAPHVELILRVVLPTTLLNASISLPYMAQLAHSRTMLTAISNTIAVTIVLPTMCLLTLRWHAVGAALAGLGLNLGYALVLVPIMHLNVVKGGLSRWWWHALLLPSLVCFPTAFLIARLAPRMSGLPSAVALSGICVLICATLLSAALPFPRALLKTLVTR